MSSGDEPAPQRLFLTVMDGNRRRPVEFLTSEYVSLATMGSGGRGYGVCCGQGPYASTIPLRQVIVKLQYSGFVRFKMQGDSRKLHARLQALHKHAMILALYK